MPRAMASPVLAIVTGAPSNAIVPVSACSTPDRILIMVDLPAPFSPTSACTRPAWMVISALRIARTAPKLLEIPRISRRGGCSTVIGSVVELVDVVLGDGQRRPEEQRLGRTVVLDRRQGVADVVGVRERLVLRELSPGPRRQVAAVVDG